MSDSNSSPAPRGCYILNGVHFCLTTTDRASAMQVGHREGLLMQSPDTYRHTFSFTVSAGESAFCTTKTCPPGSAKSLAFKLEDPYPSNPPPPIGSLGLSCMSERKSCLCHNSIYFFFSSISVLNLPSFPPQLLLHWGTGAEGFSQWALTLMISIKT